MMLSRIRGFAEGLDRYLNSPFRRKHYKGAVDVEAIQWAIGLLEIHPGVKVNPNSQYWLDRLRANLHHAKRDLESTAADRGTDRTT